MMVGTNRIIDSCSDAYGINEDMDCSWLPITYFCNGRKIEAGALDGK